MDPTSVLDGQSTSELYPPKSNCAVPLAEPPYEAWPVTGQICFTYGGLKVGGRSRVLDTEGAVIPGLYAAGRSRGSSIASTRRAPRGCAR